MRSTFGGLQVAASGLAAQRRAIEAAGQNIANVNTPGYSRQRVDLAAMASHTAGIHTGSATWGVGVQVTGQSRIVDQFLIQRVQAERSSQGFAEEIQTTYSRLELTFGEPGDSGLAAQLEDFWNAWDTVVIAPEDLAARSALLQQAEGVANRFADLSASMDAQVDDAIERAKVVVDDVNATAKQIARLNTEISAAAQLGTSANELMDQRDELVRQLSDKVGISTRINDDGMMHINVGSVALVQGANAHEMALHVDGDPPTLALHMSNTTLEVDPRTGSLAALKTSVNDIIPKQQTQLDQVAAQLVSSVNGTHVTGNDLSGTSGRLFFDGASARDIRLHGDVVGQPGNVAAALPTEGVFGGGNAALIGELAGGPADDAYRTLVAQLGVDAQTASRVVDLQTKLTQQAQGQHDAVSGVSIDEEMTNLVAYQQAYSAAARFMTTIDEMLNTLISGTGVVGR
ncbi:flagellar hook-associated protein FlgK [Euzebya sp.]|uniref:flagellar hook-associated protein FlgK n=1 Tax=Euzebya sp. TaxID=1971409 RepID=UPI00351618E3